MAIVIKSSKKVTIPVENENGEKLGEIVFNPESAGTYKALTEITEAIYKISDKYDSIGELKEIPRGELTPEKEKQARDDFERISKFTGYMTEQIDEIAKAIDSAFGKGTSALILQGGYDIEGLVAFIDGVAPYFKNMREKQVGKYLKDADDVM